MVTQRWLRWRAAGSIFTWRRIRAAHCVPATPHTRAWPKRGIYQLARNVPKSAAARGERPRNGPFPQSQEARAQGGRGKERDKDPTDRDGGWRAARLVSGTRRPPKPQRPWALEVSAEAAAENIAAGSLLLEPILSNFLLLRICVGLTPPTDWFSDQTIHLWFLFVVKKYLYIRNDDLVRSQCFLRGGQSNADPQY